jgi:hypothetical protein
MTPMIEETITTEELRLHVAELAAKAHIANASFAVQASRGGPRYQLAAVCLVDAERARACVRVTPDEFRRHSSDIRALARVDDVPFGIVVRGQLMAIFARHPQYRSDAATRFRDEFLARQSKAPGDLGDRVNALSAKVATVGAILEEHTARLEAIENSQTRARSNTAQNSIK